MCRGQDDAEEVGVRIAQHLRRQPQVLLPGLVALRDEQNGVGRRAQLRRDGVGEDRAYVHDDVVGGSLPRVQELGQLCGRGLFCARRWRAGWQDAEVFVVLLKSRPGRVSSPIMVVSPSGPSMPK